MVALISARVCKCNVCGYVWKPRADGADMPKRCAGAKCKSPYWDSPKKLKSKKKGGKA